jgi:ribonucleoside-diphosphate reductase alpha chain
MTLDIEVPETVTYIANSVVSHNTIGMVAETTTGVEPLFCAAYKRRYFKEGKWMFQYVIDGSVKRLMQRGVSRELIERNDAYALGFEQRVKFQADVQDYVDMSISSTCNMAAWGSVLNNEDTVQEYSDILYKYAPRLRGFTCYPDGSRGGQPLTKVSLREAGEKEGMIYAEEVRECLNGVCGL